MDSAYLIILNIPQFLHFIFHTTFISKRVSQGCLDALRVTNGATHTEVMMTEDGPCLVEVNSRCHGANGAWMPLVQALLLGGAVMGAKTVKGATFMDEE